MNADKRRWIKMINGLNDLLDKYQWDYSTDDQCDRS